MNLKFLSEGFTLSSRRLAAATLLTSGTLGWFFVIYKNIGDIYANLTLDPLWNQNVGQMLFYGSAITWAIIGSLIEGRANRRKLLISWISLGVFSTVSLTLFQGTIFATISSLLLGMSLGLGLPSSIALMADYTAVEERARVAGVVILSTFVIGFGTILLSNILEPEIIGGTVTILLFAAARSTSFLALMIDKDKGQTQIPVEKPRLPSTAYRDLVYYLVPFVMFTIAASLAWNMFDTKNPAIKDAAELGSYVRFLTIAISGLIWGIVADRFGRKQPIIAGLIILGVSFALLGFSPNITGTSVIIYLAISGLAWGSFFVIFLAVPGDLSVLGSREKFYAIGYVLPLAILFGMSSVPGDAIFKTIPASSFALILSLILFLTIVPVLRLKETLPIQKIRERKMKEYVNKVGKTVQKSKEEENEES